MPSLSMFLEVFGFFRILQSLLDLLKQLLGMKEPSVCGDRYLHRDALLGICIKIIFPLAIMYIFNITLN